MNRFAYHLLFDDYIEDGGNNEINVINEFILNIKGSIIRQPKQNQLIDLLDKAKKYYDIYNNIIYDKPRKYGTIKSAYYNYKTILRVTGIKISDSDPMLLCSGYSDTGGSGHSIMMYIEKLSALQYRVKLFNSGEGTEYNKDSLAGMVKFDVDHTQIQYLVAHSIWMNAAWESNAKDDPEKLNIDIFYARIIEIINTGECRFYNQNDKKPNPAVEIFDIKSIKNDPNKKFIVLQSDVRKPQLSGSCTFYSKLFWIEHMIDDNGIYQAFLNGMREKYIDYLLNENKKNTLINQYNILYLLNYNYPQTGHKKRIEMMIHHHIMEPHKLDYTISNVLDNIKGDNLPRTEHISDRMLERLGDIHWLNNKVATNGPDVTDILYEWGSFFEQPSEKTIFF